MKGINWKKVFLKNKKKEMSEDAKRVAELVKELYDIFKKHKQIH